MIDSFASKSSDAVIWKGQWLGWLVLGILVLFTWLPNNYYLVVAWPWIVVWQTGFLLLGVWLIWMLRQFQIPFRCVGYGFDGFVVWTAITLILSAIFSQFVGVAAWNVSIGIYYGVLLYVLRNWLGKGQLSLSRLWIGLSFTGVIASVIGLMVWWQNYTPEDPRNGWPIGHPNFLAGYLLLVLPLTFYWGVDQKGWRRLAAWGASLLLLFVLYTTSSRGGFLGLFVLIVVSILFWLLQSHPSQRIRRLLMVGVALVAVVVILLSNPRVQQIIHLSSPQNTPAVQVTVDGESQERLYMWRSAWQIFKAHPLLGIGPGNMARVYDLYRPVEAGLLLINLQELHSTPIHITGELGLMGLAAYLLFLGCCTRLWIRLYRHCTEPKNRYLLYGIGSSLLAYTVSSLTDYQLDNIAICVTLIALIALLIRLADLHQLSISKEFTSLSRRWYSLGAITVMVISIILWIPVSRAMSLAVASERNFNAGKIEEAYQQASLAATLVPWDPIYHLQAAYEVLKVRDTIQDGKLYRDLTEDAINNFQNLINQAAPNDIAFNQVLGMLYRDVNKSDQAIKYLSRGVQLLPRSPLYTYYLLGREYLQLQQREKAITALALQGLIQPSFFFYPLWNQPGLSEVKKPVAEETIRLFSILKQKTDSPDITQQIDEIITLIKWDSNFPLEKAEKKHLNPLVKALLLANSSPEESLTILNQALKAEPTAEPLLLLRAWIDPKQYLGAYFQQFSNQLTTRDKEFLENSIYRNRDIKTWLSSLLQQPKSAPKIALILTYRNYQGRNLAYIPLPSELQIPIIVNKLSLFPEFSRLYPQLDELINQVKTERLNLPHPPDNKYQLLSVIFPPYPYPNLLSER
ncbi:O-antigen ligase family protein [Gloeothece verrucosa]|uniref:O-antigen polymerase n=1 Tax=Gloeothece verrucosa (strain PCC 7822) TaxID=497965 RepID=E0U7S3_GLOV7|nr:O-antigen ligase family protein [Gloeothece verrucosa]ADN14885.1 O-antigen polymerase [Gloeothece verrucosa PCC 7822]